LTGATSTKAVVSPTRGSRMGEPVGSNWMHDTIVSTAREVDVLCRAANQMARASKSIERLATVGATAVRKRLMVLAYPGSAGSPLGESDGEFRADLKSTSALAGLNLRSARKRQSVTWIRHRKIGVGNPPSRCGKHRKSHEDRTQWRQKPRASSLGLGSRRQSDRAIDMTRLDARRALPAMRSMVANIARCWSCSCWRSPAKRAPWVARLLHFCRQPKRCAAAHLLTDDEARPSLAKCSAAAFEPSCAAR